MLFDFRSSRCCWVLWLVVSAGCGSDDSGPTFEPTEWQGNVDPSLPANVQAKQDALIRLFTAIQDVGIERVTWDCPDVDFDESFEQFFEGTVDLYRWEWAAPPDDDRLHVRLILRRDDAELSEVETTRIYRVRRRGRIFVVRRIPDDQASPRHDPR